VSWFHDLSFTLQLFLLEVTASRLVLLKGCASELSGDHRVKSLKISDHLIDEACLGNPFLLLVVCCQGFRELITLVRQRPYLHKVFFLAPRAGCVLLECFLAGLEIGLHSGLTFSFSHNSQRRIISVGAISREIVRFCDWRDQVAEELLLLLL